MSTALTPARASGRDHEVDADPHVALARELDAQRGAIVRHCARMLGSASDAEDATQETMVRAWRGLAHFEGRSSLATWLYAIATNVCLNMLRGAERRPRPVEVVATLDEDGDPADRAIRREDVRRAVAVALVALPPRQRAVLFLRVVCAWRSREVAELLETSVAAVNSALQRARAALDAAATSEPLRGTGVVPNPQLVQYVDALEHADVHRLVALAHADARPVASPDTPHA